jgi:hypothetical protein
MAIPAGLGMFYFLLTQTMFPGEPHHLAFATACSPDQRSCLRS